MPGKFPIAQEWEALLPKVSPNLARQSFKRKSAIEADEESEESIEEMEVEEPKKLQFSK